MVLRRGRQLGFQSSAGSPRRGKTFLLDTNKLGTIRSGEEQSSGRSSSSQLRSWCFHSDVEGRKYKGGIYISKKSGKDTGKNEGGGGEKSYYTCLNTFKFYYMMRGKEDHVRRPW